MKLSVAEPPKGDHYRIVVFLSEVGDAVSMRWNTKEDSSRSEIVMS